MTKRYLDPIDGRKSFYKKATAVEDDGVTYLKSYNTIVGFINNGTFHRTWGGYSCTTMRHVNAFLNTYNVFGDGNKKWWEGLPVETIPWDKEMRLLAI